MEPQLGWAALSRLALARAQKQLSGDSEGVQDEVGVRTLQREYADRFFPGTSTAMTRLRYALFVPWQISKLLSEQKKGGGLAKLQLKEEESTLVNQLPHESGSGTIGLRSQGQYIVRPPSEIYWRALTVWGILSSGTNGQIPGREELFVNWEHWVSDRKRRSLTDLDGQSLEISRRLFHPKLPQPPAAFNRNSRLSFDLLSRERKFLKDRLIETHRPSDERQPSLLSILAGSGIEISDRTMPWSAKIRSHPDTTDSDRKALPRAQQAAAISAVTRAIYLAAVEKILQKKDRKPTTTGNRHLQHLEIVVSEYRKKALKLRLDDLKKDQIDIGDLREVFEAVQMWLKGANHDPLDQVLLDKLCQREKKLKGKRAKLSYTTNGSDARLEWRDDEIRRFRTNENLGLAKPIDYRWGTISRLLRDLSVEH